MSSESEEASANINQLVRRFFSSFYELYLKPLSECVEKNPQLLETVAGFLLAPTRIVIYAGRTHIVIEFEGPDRIAKFPDKDEMIYLRGIDYQDIAGNLFDKIIGFDYADCTSGFQLPLLSVYEDLIAPTNRGLEKLTELGWNFSAQDHMVSFNGGGLSLVKGTPARIINGFFFDATDKGLITRHIKWADCIPIEFDDSHPDFDRVGFSLAHYVGMAVRDATYCYPVPKDFRLKKLPQINRFIEHFSSPERTEPEITSFLSQDEYQFILTMRFGCASIISQPKLEWQSEKREAIQPDFLLVGTNGYGDICEFKLPHLKGDGVVGKKNRETFSAEVNSYVSQTRVYREYFDDPTNRKWVEAKFGIKVYKPLRYLVIGARSDLESDEWKKIESDHQDLRIFSYNDVVDGVIVQFYK